MINLQDSFSFSNFASWRLGGRYIRIRRRVNSRKGAKNAKFGLFPLLQRGTKGDFAIRKISPYPSFPKRGRRGSWRPFDFTQDMLGGKKILKLVLFNVSRVRMY